MKAFIAFFEQKEDQIINHGTFDRPEGLTYDERCQLAKDNGVPDSWTHCRIWNEGQVWPAIGHHHHYQYPYEWVEVDENGVTHPIQNGETKDPDTGQ